MYISTWGVFALGVATGAIGMLAIIVIASVLYGKKK